VFGQSWQNSPETPAAAVAAAAEDAESTAAER